MSTLTPVYQRTLDLLRQDGWYKGGSKSPDGKRCLVRALDEAAPTAIEYEKAWMGIRALIDCPGVAQWNDNPRRTFAEVEALLLQAMA